MTIISELLAQLITFLFSIVANIDLSGMTEAIQFLRPYFQTVMYFLPVGTLRAIFSVILAIWTARLTIRTIITIWDLLPIA